MTAEVTKEKNRWLIALSAVGIHISIGSVYAWSVFTKPLVNSFDWSLKEVQFTFSLAITFLGLSAAFLGRFVEKHGPRKAGILSAVFFGVGLLGSGLAVKMENLYLLYLFYGVIGGIGLGCGYIAPVSTLVKWFPDRRGLATGLAIMGFGFASLIAAPVMAKIIESQGVAFTFLIFGAVYFVIMLAASQYLAPPPEGWLPAAFKEKIESGEKELKKDLAQFDASQAVRTKRFYYLWLMLFINVTCGIAVISVASPMAQEIAGMSVAAASAMVGLMGLFNGAGRIAWASASDYLGRANTYLIFFVLQVIAFILLPKTATAIVFQVMVFLILTCYGGGFATVPAFIGDLFGTKQLGAIHGYILTAWSAAGIVGPTLSSFVREKTGSYTQTLYIFAGFFAAAIVISVLMKIDIAQLQKSLDSTQESE
ncbi:MAG: L-lactate MFS transporter [Planctomycetota bacterium]|jgi:OFA family oxalate/formate antiporter-like MFS transporter